MSEPGVIRQKVGQLVLVRQQSSSGRVPGLNLYSFYLYEERRKHCEKFLLATVCVREIKIVILTRLLISQIISVKQR